MPGLNDDCWLLIFQRLNLNERRAVRLTCKRFKSLCDLVQIQKLVIYERREPLPGRLRYTNEPYGLEHTAYVVNLRRFFDNERIIEQMSSIRVLIIHGDWRIEDWKKEEVDLKVKFERLNYLELHLCMFISPILLSSTQLEFLIIDFALMRPEELIRAKEKEIKESKSGDSWWWYALGLEELESRRLKFFSLNIEIDETIPKKAINSHLFDRLEEAHLCFSDWQSIEPLVRKEHCPMLRRLNIRMGSHDVQEIVDSVQQADLSKLFSSFNEKLTVHLFGFPFDQQHKPAMVEFFKTFDQKIQVGANWQVLLELDQQIYSHIKKWNKKVNLAQFYQTVGDLTVRDSSEQLYSDHEFFKGFSRCNSIAYHVNPKPADLEGHLDVLTNLKKIQLACTCDNPHPDRILDAIGEKCSKLERLTFHSCERIEFGFLFKLQRLRYLNMQLAFTPSKCTLIDYLRNHRDLVGLEICFIRSKSESKNNLKNFKKLVNETFSERFEARKLEFRVQIRTKTAGKRYQFVRYLLHKIDHEIEISRMNKANMFSIIWRKRSQLGRKGFKKLFGQRA